MAFRYSPLFHAGLVAAGFRLGAVAIVTVFAFLSASHDLLNSLQTFAQHPNSRASLDPYMG